MFSLSLQSVFILLSALIFSECRTHAIPLDINRIIDPIEQAQSELLIENTRRIKSVFDVPVITTTTIPPCPSGTQRNKRTGDCTELAPKISTDDVFLFKAINNYYGGKRPQPQPHQPPKNRRRTTTTTTTEATKVKDGHDEVSTLPAGSNFPTYEISNSDGGSSIPASRPNYVPDVMTEISTLPEVIWDTTILPLEMDNLEREISTLPTLQNFDEKTIQFQTESPTEGTTSKRFQDPSSTISSKENPQNFVTMKNNQSLQNPLTTTSTLDPQIESSTTIIETNNPTTTISSLFDFFSETETSDSLLPKTESVSNRFNEKWTAYFQETTLNYAGLIFDNIEARAVTEVQK